MLSTAKNMLGTFSQKPESDIFIETQDRQRFFSNGFFKTQLIHPGKTAQILELYYHYNLHQRKNNHISGLTYSLFELSGEKNRLLSAALHKLLRPCLDDTFKNYWAGAFSFITKRKFPDELLLHRDWNYTDEQKYFSMTAWVALDNIDRSNGGLYFMKGSHREKNILRSGTYKTKRLLARDYGGESTFSKLMPGEALFFHPKTLHGSFPNKTDKPRIVLNFILKPKDAPLVHYKKASPFFAKIYRLREEDFFYNLPQISEGKLGGILKPAGYKFYLNSQE